MIEFKVFCGFCFNPDGQTDNKWTDICNCRVAFMTEKIKSVDFFHTSWTPPPPPTVWKISRNFAIKKGQKQAKSAKKTSFFQIHTFYLLFLKASLMNYIE